MLLLLLLPLLSLRETLLLEPQLCIKDTPVLGILQVKDIKWKRLTLGRDTKEQEHALLPRIKAMLILLL